MKRFLALLLIVALAFTLVACDTEKEEPKKEERKKSTESDAAIFTLYVNYSLGYCDISSPDAEKGIPTVETIRDIITSYNCLQEVASRIQEKYDITPPQPAELREMIYVTTAENSDVIQVGVAAEDDQLSLQIANALCEVTPEVICRIIEGSSAKIVDSPYLGTLEVA